MELLEFNPEGRFVFVGDTHGDFDASRNVLSRYFNEDTKVCFLGDYVDRGSLSKQNIDYLLEEREKNPKNIFLLQGNHEAHDVVQFRPADFWNNLSNSEYEHYTNIFKEFPYVLSTDGIIALHGVPPEVGKIKDIKNLSRSQNDKIWNTIMWGDFREASISGRPAFDKKYFNKVMKKLNKNVLIRSHQPDVPLRMFDNQCLTIFTSNAYGSNKRIIAIVDFNKHKVIETIDDVIIENV